MVWVTHSTVRGNLVGMTNSWGRSRRKLRGPLPCAYFGPCGSKKIGGHLMMLNSWTKQSNIILCLSFGNELKYT